MLAAVHLTPWITIPLALLLMAGAAWYWWRLGGEDVPRSRRVIRRSSILLIVASAITLVSGLSVVDSGPDADPQRYLIVWTIAGVMVLTVLVSAGIDILNNLRLHAQHHHEEMMQSTLDLVDAMQKVRQSQGEETGAKTHGREEAERSQ